jgi:hypothetical protein
MDKRLRSASCSDKFQRPIETTAHLPTDFASQLIAKEFQLESCMNIELIQELAQLYAVAIEYYEHINDMTYLDY